VKFAVEAWDPDYGTSGDVAELDPSTDVVDVSVERPTDEWSPIAPEEMALPTTVFFVDGVRRIDARIWVTDGGRVLPGSCATVAAGTVACTSNRAEIVAANVLRGVFTPPSETAGSIATKYGTYEYFPVKTGSPEDLYLGIHDQMTNLETQTIPTAGPDDLVVFDGPLRGRTDPRSVGLIKTQHVQYLDENLQLVVADLDSGERTPIFQIGVGRFGRWSWYQRLPGPRTHGWAGIVRCELAGAAPISASIEVANQVVATLPRYASEAYKEPRAPQNLYPIKGLESALRRPLGDQRQLQRALRTAARVP
jgi:hypothetical protein